MILGMGAAAIVVESADAAAERGIRPDLRGARRHHRQQRLPRHPPRRGPHRRRDGGRHRRPSAAASSRAEVARRLVFVSHETYTPARGGSAAAEVHALRRVFGADADRIVITNTKGFTGHPMGVGIEDVVAVKALETGVVPPVPNYKEVDPDLGSLNLSVGGVYPIGTPSPGRRLRLADQHAALRWVPSPDGRRPHPDELGVATGIADAGMAGVALPGERPGRPVARGGPPHAARRRHRSAGRRPAADASRRHAPRLPRPATTGGAGGIGRPDSLQAREWRDAGRQNADLPITPSRGPVAASPGRSGNRPRPDQPVTGAATVGPRRHRRWRRAAIRWTAVIALVAEQTGYPPELLDLDLDLEADLGIDTVKQAELFAQVRQTYDIPRDDNLKLRDYPTLAHVIGFVRDRAPHTSSPPVAAALPRL
jgi:acyl carrier protein